MDEMSAEGAWEAGSTFAASIRAGVLPTAGQSFSIEEGAVESVQPNADVPAEGEM
jgi:hypothetical protein